MLTPDGMTIDTGARELHGSLLELRSGAAVFTGAALDIRVAGAAVGSDGRYGSEVTNCFFLLYSR